MLVFEVLLGDVIYTPMGAVVVEKALNADVVSWRVCVPTIGAASLMRSYKMLLAESPEVGWKPPNAGHPPIPDPPTLIV